MQILEGLFTINGHDPYLDFGAFLAESDAAAQKNYAALLQPPALKKQSELSIREHDGVKLPDTLTQCWEARDVTLEFAITAPDAAAFRTRYYAFVDFLKQGDDGWLTVHLPEIGRSWKMYLTGFTAYSQLTPFEGEMVARFSVKLREPNPNF